MSSALKIPQDHDIWLMDVPRLQDLNQGWCLPYRDRSIDELRHQAYTLRMLFDGRFDMITDAEAQEFHDYWLHLEPIDIKPHSNLESRALVTITREDHLLAIARHFRNFLAVNLPVEWDYHSPSVRPPILVSIEPILDVAFVKVLITEDGEDLPFTMASFCNVASGAIVEARLEDYEPPEEEEEEEIDEGPAESPMGLAGRQIVPLSDQSTTEFLKERVFTAVDHEGY